MDFFQVIQKRYSVRSYKPDPVEDQKLQSIIEAARLAPTASNRQPFKFIVIHTSGREAELNQIYARPWFAQAPLLIGIFTTPDIAWVRRDGKNYSDIDAAIAMDHLILAATELGLGTCWVAAFDPVATRRVLGLPEGVEPIAFTPLGYPNDQPKAKKRKTSSDLVKYDRW
ncbi:MAG: nitroreductase family protein [Chloroflexi bacterium]|nr:nitroreductase family protein [Chloroflexota bacterium]